MENEIRRNSRLGSRNLPPCTMKQAILASFNKAKKSIQRISDGDLSEISNLEHHMFFMKSQKLCNEFFSIFDFDFFIDQILLDNSYSFSSLIICAQCIDNEFCPEDYIDLISSNSDLANFLFSTILPKYKFKSSIPCFKFFKLMALNTDVRDALLNLKIIEIINTISNNEKIEQRNKRPFLFEASKFLFNCLRSSPISDESILDDIVQTYFSFLHNDDAPVVVHSINLLDNMKRIDGFESSYPDLLQKSYDFIYDNYVNTESTEIALAVYKLLRDIDSIEYMNLTLDYLQNSNSIKVMEKCLKTMIKRSEEWSLIDNEEVCQILINTANESSFIIRKLATKVLILYWDQSKMITSDFMNLLIVFLSEKKFGIECMNVILSFLTGPFTQNEIESFAEEFWSQDLESIICNIIQDGNEDESHTATLLLDAFHEIFP